jgi:hypothetical protein
MRNKTCVKHHDTVGSFKLSFISNSSVRLTEMDSNTQSYFRESSIHGFPWIINRRLHVFEKILWIVALLISFVCCGYLIFEIGMMYREDSMVTYTSDTAIAVTDVSWISKIFTSQSSRCFQRFHSPL